MIWWGAREFRGVPGGTPHQELINLQNTLERLTAQTLSHLEAMEADFNALYKIQEAVWKLLKPIC